MVDQESIELNYVPKGFSGVDLTEPHFTIHRQKKQKQLLNSLLYNLLLALHDIGPQSTSCPQVLLIIAPVRVFARSDARKAIGLAVSSTTGIRLSNVIWLSPSVNCSLEIPAVLPSLSNVWWIIRVSAMPNVRMPTTLIPYEPYSAAKVLIIDSSAPVTALIAAMWGALHLPGVAVMKRMTPEWRGIMWRAAALAVRKLDATCMYSSGAGIS
jgi:hypothetical protein